MAFEIRLTFITYTLSSRTIIFQIRHSFVQLNYLSIIVYDGVGQAENKQQLWQRIYPKLRKINIETIQDPMKDIRRKLRIAVVIHEIIAHSINILGNSNMGK